MVAQERPVVARPRIGAHKRVYVVQGKMMYEKREIGYSVFE
jgi:hypothetical protein